MQSKLLTAISNIGKGEPIEDVSKSLDWRDFEILVSHVLSEKNFSVNKNFILTKPRMQIDVVGLKLDISLLIDCKHWKKMSDYNLRKIVCKQVERVKKYVEKTESSIALPVIVTLHDERVSFVNKVPIVPITQLSSFLDDVFGNLDCMQTIEKQT